MTNGVTVIDHDEESRAWLRERFESMATEMVTTWDIAQDIAANWTEGRSVGDLPECQGKTQGQVFREWVDGYPGSTLDSASTKLLTAQVKSARAWHRAPAEYKGFGWSLYRYFPETATDSDIAAAFKAAEAQPTGISKRAMQIVLGKATGMKPPYWQQVIENLMTGEHDLTPSTARNIIATAQRWLQENPDAPERR